MPPSFASQLGMPFDRQTGLGDDSKGEPQDPAPAGVPVSHPGHPQQVGSHRVTLARELAVPHPVLSEAVMSHVLHLIEGARIEQHEAEHTAHPLIHPAPTKYGPMPEFILPALHEVE